MDIRIIITEDYFNHIRKTLFPLNNNGEHFGFGLSGFNYYDGGCDILLRMFLAADKSCLVKQSGVSVRPDPSFISYVLMLAAESKSGLIDIHTHPFSNNEVGFSGIDDRSEAESFPKAVEFLGEGPHASIVLGQNSIAARWYNPKTKSTEPIRAIKILGRKVTILIPSNYRSLENEND